MVTGKKYILPLLLSAILSCLLLQVSGQTDSIQYSEGYYEKPIEIRKLDEKKWKNLKNEMDFSDRKKDPKQNKKDNNNENTGNNKSENNAEEEDNMASESSTFAIPEELIYVAYAFIIIIVIFILMKIFRIQSFGSNQKVNIPDKSVKMDASDEEMMESDLERFLKEAIKQQNYKLAIRLNFLIILKELTERNWIRWKKDKTNRDYLSEMSVRKEIQTFTDLTRIFEKSWYSENQIKEKDYIQLSPYFTSFIEQIRKIQA
jgi:hypothetical protein